jgi:hypothetical protein
MAAIRPEDIGFSPLLSENELRRLSLAINKDFKKASKKYIEKENIELNRILELEKQKMREYEERCKNAIRG